MNPVLRVAVLGCSAVSFSGEQVKDVVFIFWGKLGVYRGLKNLPVLMPVEIVLTEYFGTQQKFSGL